ncbi:MAG: hypothetical protein WDW38_009352 [Sanguina aurantia]
MAIWNESFSLDASDIQQLRQDAWNMFDHGYSKYMQHAFPRDNLLPVSCRGQDWQGGIGLTLVDALDTLLLMNRRADMAQAVELVRRKVHFNRDIKVGLWVAKLMHTVFPPLRVCRIRVLCVWRAPTLSSFASSFSLCVDAHFKQASLPSVSLLLQRSQRFGQVRVRKFGHSGLVGSSMDTLTHHWISKETTIGPGADSYYEYLLKAYLMFGDEKYLEMFGSVYTSTMQYLKMPGTYRGYSFLVDVSMDTGRITKPYVSSLSAFWPGMQALIGQNQEAVDLHANFTATWQRQTFCNQWQQFGWLPESFGIDASNLHPEEAGHNLRPEHIESTYVLHAVTGDPHYLQHDDGRIRGRSEHPATLVRHNKVACGYTNILNVETGSAGDLMESYFLSETVKYLYIIFSEAPEFLEYFTLSTEGHMFPIFTHPRDAARNFTADTATGPIPDNCRRLCTPRGREAQEEVHQRLQAAFPLIHFDEQDAAILRQRRCTACVGVTAFMAATPKLNNSVKAKIMKLPAEDGSDPDPQPATNVMAQVVCTLKVLRDGSLTCNAVRRLTQHDVMHGMPHNAVLLQMTATPVLESLPGLLIVRGGPTGAEVSLHVEAGTAAFGPQLIEITRACHDWVLDDSHGTNKTSSSLPPLLQSEPMGLWMGHLVHGPTQHQQLSTPPAVAAASAMLPQDAAGHETSHTFQRVCRIEDAQCVRHSPSPQDSGAAIAESPQDSGAAIAESPQDSSAAIAESPQDSGAAIAESPQDHPLHLSENNDPPQRDSPHSDSPHGDPVPSDSPHSDSPDLSEGGSGQSDCDPDASGWEAGSISRMMTHGPCMNVPVTHGRLVWSHPRHGCSSHVMGASSGVLESLEGAVAMIERGGCSFTTKALVAQQAGAIGVIIVNTLDEGELVSMSGDPDPAHTPAIPTLLITRQSGWLLERANYRNPHTLYATMALASGRMGTLPMSNPQSVGRSPVSTQATPTEVDRSPVPAPSIPTEAPVRTPKTRKAPAGPRKGEGKAPRVARPRPTPTPQKDDPELGTGKSTPDAPHLSSASNAWQPTSRVDLLIPQTSHAFIQANVIAKGRDLMSLFHSLAADGRALVLLQEVATAAAVLKANAIEIAQRSAITHGEV